MNTLAGLQGVGIELEADADREPVDLYTVKEVARRFQMVERTIFRMIKRGELASRKVGSRVRVYRQSVETYLAAGLQTVTAGPAPSRKPARKGKGDLGLKFEFFPPRD